MPLLSEWQNFRSGRSVSSRINRHHHTPGWPQRCNSGRSFYKAAKKEDPAKGISFRSSVRRAHLTSLSPLATKVVPVSAATFMHIVGVVEIIAGLVVFSRWTKLGSQIVALWLLGIAVNLLTTGMFYDLAMRDLEIAIAAFVLSQLSAVRAQQSLRPYW